MSNAHQWGPLTFLLLSFATAAAGNELILAASPPGGPVRLRLIAAYLATVLVCALFYAWWLA